MPYSVSLFSSARWPDHHVLGQLLDIGLQLERGGILFFAVGQFQIPHVFNRAAALHALHIEVVLCLLHNLAVRKIEIGQVFTRFVLLAVEGNGVFRRRAAGCEQRSHHQNRSQYGA